MNQSFSKETGISVLAIGSKPEENNAIQEVLNQETEFQLVGLVATGHEGVERAKELKPDIVLIDFSTPDMDSIAVLIQVKEVAPSARIIMMSKFNDVDWMQSALQTGAHNFYSKPIKRDYFCSVLRETYKQIC